MRTLFIAVAVIASFFIGGCEYTGWVNCTDSRIAPVFRGYDSASLTEVLLIRYEAGSNFAKPIDTVLSGNIHARLYRTNTYETTPEYYLENLDNVIKPGNDWRIQVVPFNKTYSISGLYYKQERLKMICPTCDGKHCDNPINYSMNGQVVETYLGDFSEIEINK